ncbi:MAG: GNAT family N-acetyltransferase [Nitrospiria bacterium]
MTVFYRDTKQINVKELVKLYSFSNWAKFRSPQEAEEILEHSSLVMSAWEGIHLVGFARVLTDFIFRAAIYDVIVHPDFQHQGLGSGLITKLLTHRSLSRVEVFHLLTKINRKFYEKVGFVKSDQEGYASMTWVRKTSPVPNIVDADRPSS